MKELFMQNSNIYKKRRVGFQYFNYYNKGTLYAFYYIFIITKFLRFLNKHFFFATSTCFS